MWMIARLDFKKHIQDKGMLFWMFVLPIFFIVLFTYIFSAQVEGDRSEVIVHIVPGYVVMFTFFIMISMASQFVKDGRSGMVSRMASTPISEHAFLFGKWIPFILIILIQIGVLLLFGVLVYDMPLGPPLPLLVLSLALSLVSTGMGLALAVLVPSENMGLAITQIFALGGAMLSGLWVPLEFMPDFIQTIARILPQYWRMKRFRTYCCIMSD